MNDTLAGLLQVAALLVLLAACYAPLGDYMAKVFTTERHWRVETLLYRVARVDPSSGQRWPVYAAGVLGFSFVSIVLLYLLQRLQPVLPASFDRGSVGPATAFNTAISFVTNTNWQSYVPEQTLGNTVQMAGLTVQNVLSAAVGIAVAVALIRGIVASNTDRIGNFWVDLTRAVVRIMLPFAFVAAVLLLVMGVTMSLRSGVDVGGTTFPLAPTASQEAVKQLGTNGGGIFNANSAHPFENPTALSNLFEIFLLLVVPVSLTRTFGTMVGNRRQGSVLLTVMAGLWAIMLTVAWLAETHPNGAAGIAAGAMEGKETRFGVPSSILFGVSTTGTSTGAVNSLHDSYSGGAGGVTLLNMLLGEVAPGGVGAGLYGLLVLAIIAVFLAGLMVGRTPEYLGKKLGRREVTAAAVSILVMPAVVLVGAGLAIALPGTLDALNNDGAHGFSEVLYAYASAANNNGSAFAGITVTSDFFQSTLGIAMLLGRFVPILAILALAGSLAQQRRTEAGAGTLATDKPLFGVLVAGTVVLVAALTFFPALALGPIAEALA
ncbi:MAG: potassium-transporting ATPase subunit KdpA [Pseudonocardia sp.]|uniref:potassium-transporting ATPase subunit KdpA n=1 Tax=unclassified Pseudonocardia TaxID=2619320 RepID=UPI000868C5E3|nr:MULTISPECIES: potassium-transporting ATPase subunit KdpA [unclassified Pseudonocardia]MBN9109790.1 potassium-transporting ATPase subunit KdpA [Pseudonocardia sp.]ODU26765.1 MAG: potassium-transporting ATPase subunit A [Pseudonocardia sp. SCN 72-51]ODV09195.1 MAG: potassium-transporting ATPase subunit A [Pseudonocardia sp. SCN 73-27]